MSTTEQLIDQLETMPVGMPALRMFCAVLSLLDISALQFGMTFKPSRHTRQLFNAFLRDNLHNNQLRAQILTKLKDRANQQEAA